MKMEELKCTKVIKVDDGRDVQGKPRFYHKTCGITQSGSNLRNGRGQHGPNHPCGCQSE
jgi:hypothetical protein